MTIYQERTPPLFLLSPDTPDPTPCSGFCIPHGRCLSGRRLHFTDALQFPLVIYLKGNISGGRLKSECIHKAQQSSEPGTRQLHPNPSFSKASLILVILTAMSGDTDIVVLSSLRDVYHCLPPISNVPLSNRGERHRALKIHQLASVPPSLFPKP